MLTATAFADKLGLSRQRIHQLLEQGRIVGAKLIGKSKTYRGVWMIPDNARVRKQKRLDA